MLKTTITKHNVSGTGKFSILASKHNSCILRKLLMNLGNVGEYFREGTTVQSGTRTKLTLQSDLLVNLNKKRQISKLLFQHKFLMNLSENFSCKWRSKWLGLFSVGYYQYHRHFNVLFLYLKLKTTPNSRIFKFVKSNQKILCYGNVARVLATSTVNLSQLTLLTVD